MRGALAASVASSAKWCGCACARVEGASAATSGRWRSRCADTPGIRAPQSHAVSATDNLLAGPPTALPHVMTSGVTP
eukprot:969781-Pleurochrysis_carterae.AAC.1